MPTGVSTRAKRATTKFASPVILPAVSKPNGSVTPPCGISGPNSRARGRPWVCTKAGDFPSPSRTHHPTLRGSRLRTPGDGSGDRVILHPVREAENHGVCAALAERETLAHSLTFRGATPPTSRRWLRSRRRARRRSPLPFRLPRSGRSSARAQSEDTLPKNTRRKRPSRPGS